MQNSSKLYDIARFIMRECRHTYHALNPASRRHAAQWETEIGQPCLRHVGLKQGDFVLDFGCGPGRFSISAAQVVGAAGQVHAIDSNPRILRRVRRKATELKLQNLKTAGSLAELRQEPGPRLYDLVLAFDVLHFLDPHSRNCFYRELHNILADDGLLAVHAKHIKTDKPAKYWAKMTSDDVVREIEAAGYSLDQRLPLLIWHEHQANSSVVWKFSRTRNK